MDGDEKDGKSETGYRSNAPDSLLWSIQSRVSCVRFKCPVVFHSLSDTLRLKCVFFLFLFLVYSSQRVSSL